MGPEVSREELLERVRQIAPIIREYADLGERQRHLADPIVEAVRDAGLYKMIVPRDLGGLQVDPLTFYMVVEALARIDGSTGWCMFINGGGPISAAFLEDAAAESIFGAATQTIIAGSVFPSGGQWHATAATGYRSAGAMQAGVGIRRGTWAFAMSSRKEKTRLEKVRRERPS
jgi:alkylation response protein AidB-like acyl-CoA dehydrogenase